MQNAAYLPAAGWPPYRDLYERDPPSPSLREASQTAEIVDLGYRTTYNRAAGTDIVSGALAATGPNELIRLNGT